MNARSHVVRVACWLLVVLSTPSQAQDARIPINEFVVTGNTLLPTETLNSALDPYKGERTLEELNQAAQAVQALYREAGYGAVIAYVPEQRGPAGQVTIAVLEGRISRVEVIGNSQFSADNIRRSLPGLTVGSTPHVRRLDTQIRLANENPAKRIALTLEPGQQAGEVDARVLVVEQSPSLWTVAVDNTGNDSTGMYRGYLRYQQAALWDLDHVLSLQVGSSLTEPSSAVSIGGNYRIPIYEHGMTLDIFAAYSDADGGNTFTAAGSLRFSGSGEVLGALLTKHLQRWGDFDQQVGFGLDYRQYLNSCEIAGLPPGACGSAGENVSVTPLSIAYTGQKAGKNPAGFSLGLSHNLGLFGPDRSAENFDAVRPGAKQYYTLLRLAGYATLELPGQWQLQGRLSGQLTPDALIPGEQFGIAGATTVRGYIEREVIGDRGVVGSVELYAPAWLEPFGTPKAMLQGLAFVDAAAVWNYQDTPCVGLNSSCPLASVGLGLRAGLQGLQLRADVGYALKDGNSTMAGDLRTNFLVTYSF
jgi:hemolysin activation/secretion protein